jgi:hypothetical protein
MNAIPRSARIVLALLIPDRAMHEAIVGDLTEAYAHDCGVIGLSSARRSLWREIAASAPHLVRAAISPASLCLWLSFACGAFGRARSFLNEASR